MPQSDPFQRRNGRLQHMVRIIVVLLAVLPGARTSAAEAEVPAEASHDDADHRLHSHEPLLLDPTLTLARIIEETLERYPSQPELTARLAESQALAAAGGRWFSGAPTVFVSQLSDSPLDDFGQREFDAGIELSLWRIGQREAARAVGASANVEATAAAAALRWQVAGLLRATLWDIAGAADALALAQGSVDVAKELVRVVERRLAAGDLPESDALLARSSLFDRQIEAIDREAMLLDAERSYRSLTGMDARPVKFDEIASTREDFDDAHPALAFVNAEIDRTRASRSLIAKSSRGTPSVTIAPHRERGPFGTQFSDSVAMEFRMPLGGDRYGAPLRAQAGRQVAEAESKRGMLLRELDLALHEAEHELSVIEQSIDVVAARSTLVERQWEMGQAAFDLGEIDLRDLLRIEDSVIAARRDSTRYEIQRQRMIAMINQALGELP